MKLEGYHIKIGNVRKYRKLENVLYDKMMELQFPAENISLANWIHECFWRVEYLRLEGDGSEGVDLGLAHENMRMLVFRKCKTLKKLASTKTTFPHLEVLILEDLSELKEIREIDGANSINSPNPHNIVPIFNNLSSLYIAKCHKLVSLFSSSMMTGSSLLQLESLEIMNCDGMEQILLWDKDKGKENQIRLVFPKLKLLKLKSLPKFTSFCKGIESIEFSPVLEEMEILDCSLLKSFVFTTSSNGSRDNDDHATHISDKVRLVSGQQIPLNFFATLRKLKLSKHNDLKRLFSTESSSLPQLEELQISSCEMMEELIEWNEEETQTNTQNKLFPKLKLLVLDSLPRLTRLSKGIQFPLPAEIKIIECPLLGSCVSSSTTSSSHRNDDSIHLFCKTDEVEYDGLKKLQITEYRSPKTNWCPQLLLIDIFAGLDELRVYGIKGMKSLFSASVARTMSSLRCLYIVSCEEMVRVIEDDVEETYFVNPLFPKLEKLRLNKLHKLKRFCEWRCTLLLSLESLHIDHCEVMEKFTSGTLDTPTLKNIYVNGDYINIIKGDDVNTLLQLKREEEQTSGLKGSSVGKEVEEPAEMMTENVVIRPQESQEEQDRNPDNNRPRRNRKAPNKLDDYVFD